MKAQGWRNHGLFRCAPHAASGTALAALLFCLPALAGCGSPEEPPLQRVAYCQGPSRDTPDSGFVDVEFRQGSTVVARGSVSAGVVLTAEVPVGATQIYVDGVYVGAVDEGLAIDRAYRSPAPDEVNYYLRSPEGCPDSVPL
jgi:hypothetical protein